MTTSDIVQYILSTSIVCGFSGTIWHRRRRVHDRCLCNNISSRASGTARVSPKVGGEYFSRPRTGRFFVATLNGPLRSPLILPRTSFPDTDMFRDIYVTLYARTCRGSKNDLVSPSAFFARRWRKKKMENTLPGT